MNVCVGTRAYAVHVHVDVAREIHVFSMCLGREACVSAWLEASRGSARQQSPWDDQIKCRNRVSPLATATSSAARSPACALYVIDFGSTGAGGTCLPLSFVVTVSIGEAGRSVLTVTVTLAPTSIASLRGSALWLRLERFWAPVRESFFGIGRSELTERASPWQTTGTLPCAVHSGISSPPGASWSCYRRTRFLVPCVSGAVGVPRVRLEQA